MKVIGLCTDKEALSIIKDKRVTKKLSECILPRLDGTDFQKFLDEAYPDGRLGR